MRRHALVLSAAALALPALCPRVAGGQSVIAASGFNDQAGALSDPTPDSPFKLGETVNGFGLNEPGWAAPWVVSAGGTVGGYHLGKAETFAAREGDGGLSIIPTATFGATWVHRRLATLQTRQFIIEQDVNFIASGSLDARPYYSGSPQPGSFGPMWRIIGPANNRRFQVLDGDGAGSGTWEETGIAQSPGQWQHVEVDVDVATQTWGFAVGRLRYAAPDPLTFRGSPPGIDEVDYLTDTSGYIDSVVVRAPDAWWAADVNGDFRVNVADLGVLATRYNNMPVPAGRRGGDLNGDGIVDVTDLGILATFYGEPRDTIFVPSLQSAVPEPSALSLLVLTGPVLFLRRRAHAPRSS